MIESPGAFTDTRTHRGIMELVKTVMPCIVPSTTDNPGMAET
jgi:hypothetical protein